MLTHCSRCARDTIHTPTYNVAAMTSTRVCTECRHESHPQYHAA